MSEQLKRSSSGTVRRLGMSVGALALVGGIFAVPASISG
jgi:hypothetical protein